MRISDQFRTTILIVLLLTYVSATAADEPASRLRAARSLRCTFTATVATWIRSGRRTVEDKSEKGEAVYDNIDLTKGTARIVSNGGASDVVAWVEGSFGSLWFRERAPSGNEITTTIFPMYAEGTNEFVLLEARHSFVGQIGLGQESFGTCKILK